MTDPLILMAREATGNPRLRKWYETGYTSDGEYMTRWATCRICGDEMAAVMSRVERHGGRNRASYQFWHNIALHAEHHRKEWDATHGPSKAAAGGGTVPPVKDSGSEAPSPAETSEVE